MGMKIAILEDNRERQHAMARCLGDRFHQYEVRFFDAALPLIDFLGAELPNVLAIGLDHDLEMITTPTGRLADPGTGRDVVDYLTRQPPICPVVIHTTNSGAAVGMQMALEEANWPTYRVTPFGDLEWVSKLWFRTFRDAIVASVTRPRDEIARETPDFERSRP
jgi:hypothetical protein